MTAREVEWDEDQQALMLALAEYRARFCDGCGCDLDEAMSIDNEFAYVAEGPWLCWGCQAVGRAREQYVEAHPKVHRPDRWIVKKKR